MPKHDEYFSVFPIHLCSFSRKMFSFSLHLLLGCFLDIEVCNSLDILGSITLSEGQLIGNDFFPFCRLLLYLNDGTLLV